MRLEFVVFSLLAAVALGCSSSRVGSSASAEEDTVHGGEVYARYCALCHGDRGQGYAADNANALRSPEFLSTVSDEFLRAAILKGRSGTPMSAWGQQYGPPLPPTSGGQPRFDRPRDLSPSWASLPSPFTFPCSFLAYSPFLGLL
jgi:hypothetical protein